MDGKLVVFFLKKIHVQRWYVKKKPFYKVALGTKPHVSWDVHGMGCVASLMELLIFFQPYFNCSLRHCHSHVFTASKSKAREGKGWKFHHLFAI